MVVDYVVWVVSLHPLFIFTQPNQESKKKVDTTKQIIDENEALRQRIRELEEKVQNMPTSEHGSCSRNKVQKKVKFLFLK